MKSRVSRIKLAWQRGAQFFDVGDDLQGRTAALDHICRGDDLQSNACGKILTVDGIDPFQFPGRQKTVLVSAGKSAAQIQMDHFISLIGKLAEILHIFRRVDGGSLRERMVFVVGAVDFLRGNIHVVLIFLSIEDNVKRVIMDLVSAFLVPRPDHRCCRR